RSGRIAHRRPQFLRRHQDARFRPQHGSDTRCNIRFDTISLEQRYQLVGREFLQIIANVHVFPPSLFDGIGAGAQGNHPFLNPDHQASLWYSTTNPADLISLFAQIAGSLLRLSS
ncbi:MAG: hypothetical protein ACK532_00850, partial [Acidobacteriota bacterium]